MRTTMMKNENMINKLHEADMLYFVLGSLISADSLIDVEACHKALDCLENLRRDFETSKLKEDQKLKSLLEPDGSDVPLHILIDVPRRRRFIITHRVKHIQHPTIFPPIRGNSHICRWSYHICRWQKTGPRPNCLSGQALLSSDHSVVPNLPHQQGNDAC